MKATISGTTHGEISGGGFWQQEHPEIAARFRSRRAGFGYQLEADLTAVEIEDLRSELIAQAELLESGGTDDDALYRKVARQLRRDAERLPQPA